jgi:hypothetical protein
MLSTFEPTGHGMDSSVLATFTFFGSVFACASYAARDYRLVFHSADCLTVTDSRFIDQHGVTGGAIWTDSSVTHATIQDSLFYSCYSPECEERGWGDCWDWIRSGYGGAINHDGSSLALTRCCGVGCYAWLFGNFVRLTKRDSSHVISHLSMVSIGISSSYAGIGGIYCDGTIGLTINCINSTSCFAYGFGSVVYSADDSGFYSLTYANTVNCKDCYSMVENDNISPCSSVTFCNFYGNGANRGVISSYSSTSPLSIDQCIFNGNAGNRDLYAKSLKLEVSNCFFSSPSFPSSYAGDFTGNTVSSVTESYWIFAVNTYRCPGVIPRTISGSPTASARSACTQSIRPTVSGSYTVTSSGLPSLTITNPLLVSNDFSRSRSLRRSVHFITSSPFDHSLDLSPSLLFFSSLTLLHFVISHTSSDLGSFYCFTPATFHGFSTSNSDADPATLSGSKHVTSTFRFSSSSALVSSTSDSESGFLSDLSNVLISANSDTESTLLLGPSTALLSKSSDSKATFAATTPQSTVSTTFSSSPLLSPIVYTRSLSLDPNAGGGSPLGFNVVGLLVGVILGILVLSVVGGLICYRFRKAESGSGTELEMANDFTTRTSPFEYENPATIEFGDYEDVFTVMDVDEMNAIALFPDANR